MLGNKLLNIQFAKYHIWNDKSEGFPNMVLSTFPNMVLSTEIFNQSVRTEYSEAVNARYTFQLLWVSDPTDKKLENTLPCMAGQKRVVFKLKILFPRSLGEDLSMNSY